MATFADQYTHRLSDVNQVVSNFLRYDELPWEYFHQFVGMMNECGKIDEIDFNGLLVDVCGARNEPIIMDYIDKYCSDINVPGKNKSTPLMILCKRNMCNMVQALIEQAGAKVNVEDANGMTAKFYATDNELIEYLDHVENSKKNETPLTALRTKETLEKNRQMYDEEIQRLKQQLNLQNM